MLRNTLIVGSYFCSLALAQNIAITSAASSLAGLAPDLRDGFQQRGHSP